mgnify:CR=1 FL=1
MEYDGLIMIVSGLIVLAVLGALLPSTNKED